MLKSRVVACAKSLQHVFDINADANIHLVARGEFFIWGLWNEPLRKSFILRFNGGNSAVGGSVQENRMSETNLEAFDIVGERYYDGDFVYGQNPTGRWGRKIKGQRGPVGFIAEKDVPTRILQQSTGGSKAM